MNPPPLRLAGLHLYIYFSFDAKLVVLLYVSFDNVLHIVIRYEIDRYVVMDRLGILTTESCGKNL